MFPAVSAPQGVRTLSTFASTSIVPGFPPPHPSPRPGDSTMTPYDFYESAKNPIFWENASKIVANTGPPPPRPNHPYAFTEIMNVTFPSPVNLDDTSTSESQLWGQTIKTYLDHPGTTKIWFGQLLDSPQVIKLIIGSYRNRHLRNSRYCAMLTGNKHRLDIRRRTQRLPRLPANGLPTCDMDRKLNAHYHQSTRILHLRKGGRVSRGGLLFARRLQ